MRRQESAPPHSAGLVDRRKVVKATWAERVRVPSGKEAEVKGWIETPAPHPQFPFWPRGDHLPSWIRTCPLIIIRLRKLREIVRNSKIKDSFCFKPGRIPGGFPVYLNPSFVKRGNNNNSNNEIIIITKDTEGSPLFFARKKGASTWTRFQVPGLRTGLIPVYADVCASTFVLFCFVLFCFVLFCFGMCALTPFYVHFSQLETMSKRWYANIEHWIPNQLTQCFIGLLIIICFFPNSW